MNPPTSRQRAWSPTTDRSRVAEATSTFTAIEARSTEGPAASRTEEVSVATEYDPFPSFLDPAKAETEVVISCDDAVLQEPPRSVRPKNLAKPPTSPGAGVAPAHVQPTPQPVPLPAPDRAAPAPTPRPAAASPPNFRPATAPPRSRVERALGIRITGARVAALVGLLLVMSAIGSAIALYLVRR